VSDGADDDNDRDAKRGRGAEVSPLQVKFREFVSAFVNAFLFVYLLVVAICHIDIINTDQVEYFSLVPSTNGECVKLLSENMLQSSAVAAATAIQGLGATANPDEPQPKVKVGHASSSRVSA